jgi:hypothetical protein
MILVASILAVVPIAAYASSERWVKYSGNPVLGPTPGGWDSEYTISPRVLYDGSSFRMWYVGGSEGIVGIGYATSSNGVAWTKYPNPVLMPGQKGSWDDAQVGLGSVVWNGTMFLMWYMGGGFVNFQDGAFGLATSPDGITWTKYSGNPILLPSDVGQRLLATPDVELSVLNHYMMWYTDRSTSDPQSSSTLSISDASSWDGKAWTTFPSPAIIPSTEADAWDSLSVYSPSVFYDGSTYWLWYSALSQNSVGPQIGFATSQDGMLYTKSPSNPILSPGQAGSWDSAGAEQPTFLLGPSGYLLYYDGFSKSAGGRIGLVTGTPTVAVAEFPTVPSDLLLGLVSCGALCLVRYRKPPSNIR